MDVEKMEIPEVLLIKPGIFSDSRGYFYESYSKRKYIEIGVNADFVQDNESLSMKGVLRGLHYQKGTYVQAKLVRVVQGSVWDVAVDIRGGSSTYGKYVSALLTAENKHQLYIPRGFAHGFLVMEDHTVVNYKCDNYYEPEFDAGVHYNDSTINIQWPAIDGPFSLSNKDCKLPCLNEIVPFGVD